jgi:hypothetical protein
MLFFACKHGARDLQISSQPMIRLLAILLILWEPLHFAAEALGVLPTIAYRGALAIAELVLHGIVAALSAAAGLALFNGSPDGRRLATFAVMAVAARTIQSQYFSVLPNNTTPGAEPVYAGVAVGIAVVAMVVIRHRPG